MNLTAVNGAATVTSIRCEHGHLVATVAPDGTIVVRHKDGCEIRIPPPRMTVVMEKTLE